MTATTTLTRGGMSNSLDTNITSFHSSIGTTIFGYFHIRRNDAMYECRTPMSKIESYLKCSLDDNTFTLLSALPTNQRPSQMVILFSSDEQRVIYRRNVLQRIERLQRGSSSRGIRVVALDLDDMVRSTIEQGIQNGSIPARRNNNFYLFRCHMAIRIDPRIRFRLFQRRGIVCPNCTNITQQLIEMF